MAKNRKERRAEARAAVVMLGDEEYRLEPDAAFLGCVKRSYNELSNKRSAMPRELRTLLIPQSIVGHAQQGHVGFRTPNGVVRYPNTTIEDVLEALNVSFKRFWNDRQERIDDIYVWLDRAVRDPADPRVRRPLNERGHYLAGCDLVPEFENANAVISALTGFVYESRMDTFDPWRMLVNRLFGVDMGGGTTVPIDMDCLAASGRTLIDLASGAHDAAAMQELVRQGIVLQESTHAARRVTNGYVRQRKGLGVSDDAALLTSGIMRGPAGFVGGNWADFVDTIDKGAARIRPGGQDEELGKFVVRECVRNGIDLGLDDLATATWIALAAIDPAQPVQWLHCSQRYFHEYARPEGNGGKNSERYPLQLHLRFAQEARAAGSFAGARAAAERMPSIRTSFSQRSNRDLYRAYVDRLEDFQEQGHIKVF